MRILYVTSEAAPYCASGGLGDVLGALPLAIKDNLKEDCQVSVILPLYSSIKDEYRQKMKKVSEFWFYHSWRNAYCGVYSLNNKGVEYLFIDNEYYFKRQSLYGEYDDGERFAYFSHAVLEFILRENCVPDILHANDWQSALTVIYAKTKYSSCMELSHMKTMFTIHNIEYQGKYGCEILGDIFDLDTSYLSVLRYRGCINLVKGAMVSADLVSTVSPNYCNELQSDFFAFGLESIVRMCSHKMCGVINGIDTKEFSSTSKDISFPFKKSNLLEGKKNNKEYLQAELGLPVDGQIPLVAMVSRLTAGKGLDLVTRVLDEMLSMNIQFVLLGTGDSEYEQIFKNVCERHPNNSRALIKFDRLLSKQIYASADIFLMPSKSEPCGLAQMIACSFGTLPLVRNVGGLHDSIIPYGEPKANGFRFDNFNAHDMFFKLKDALSLYENHPEVFNELRMNAITTDFTWKKSAVEYCKIYQKLL